MTQIDQSALLPPTLRDDFPILNGDVLEGHPLVFLDNAASTQRPRQVIDAIRRVYERDYANVHRGIHTLSERSTDQYEQANAQRETGQQWQEQVVVGSFGEDHGTVVFPDQISGERIARAQK